jgi:hypothetical protein
MLSGGAAGTDGFGGLILAKNTENEEAGGNAGFFVGRLLTCPVRNAARKCRVAEPGPKVMAMAPGSAAHRFTLRRIRGTERR